MHSDLEEISLVGMSNSELFQVDQKDPKMIEFNILLGSSLELEFSPHGFLIASSLQDDYHHRQLHHPQGPRLQLKQEIENDDDKLKQEEKKDRKSEGGVSSSSSDDEWVIKMQGTASRTRTRTLAGESEVEDNEGFRTPTSLDHGIPVIQQCPPAPRKPKPSPKRKPRSSTRHQLFLSDLSQEIGSLFSPVLLADLGPKIKKVRGCDHDTK